ncbi:MAG: hypothetical protein DHS20C17_31340 [Cyclobacteriaceae bacterium]|nr:MAG: hypothetical protein DHS20C17_31340 [Cyclobacteriaceae bacterium]
MRIAIIIDTLRPGGKERRLVELIKSLVLDYKVDLELILLSDIIHYDEVQKLGIKIHFLQRQWDKDPRVFIAFYKICESFKPHIIQSWDSMSSVYSAPVAKLLGIKFINAMIYDAPHPFKTFSSKWLRSKFTFPMSKAIVGNSNAGLKAYQAPPAKSYLIYNGFDFNRLNNMEDGIAIKRRFNISTKYLIGMVATFSHHKDYKTFINAAKIVLQDREDVSFLCIGGTKGNHRKEIESLLDPKYRNKIVLTGPQYPIEPIVNIFTIGVLSTFTEGISNAIIEYMALEKPVVATDGGGTNELVVHGKTGYLVAKKDPEEMSKRLNSLLNNPKQARTMGIEGKKRIEAHFNLSSMSGKFMELYQKLLA